jgi:AcrR family transcriptional regulator
VDLPKEAGPITRRRGKKLEDAILDAAWDELVAGGYGQFTIERVAERAAASRHVIYRRWASREDLALAAVRNRADGLQPLVPDTGTLRGDLIAALTTVNETRLEFAAVISLQFGAYYEETGTTLSDLRTRLLVDRPRSMDTLLNRAIERGEIDPARMTPLIANLPTDLIRQHVLMTLQPVPMSMILEIVDDVFLPLVRPIAQ